MERFYKKDFTFRATHYEEWQGGFCINQGPISTLILANVDDSKIRFQLKGIDYLEIYEYVEMELLPSCILYDRIQYSKGSCQWDPNDPMVCHLFIRNGHINCVRFAMTAPDRIIEFYGQEESVGIKNQIEGKKIVHSAEDIINKINFCCNDDPYSAIMERAAQMIDEHYKLEDDMDVMAFVEIIKLYHAANKILDTTEVDCHFHLRKGQLLAHLAMCQNSLGNKIYAYQLARRAMDEFQKWEKDSVLKISPLDVFGANKAEDIINYFELKYPDYEYSNDENISEYELDLTIYYKILERKRKQAILRKRFSTNAVKRLLKLLKDEYDEVLQRVPVTLFEKARIRQVSACLKHFITVLVYFLLYMDEEVNPQFYKVPDLKKFMDDAEDSLSFVQSDTICKQIISVFQQEVAFDIESLIDNIDEIING